MNYFLEWGVAPVNDAPIDPIVLDTLEFETTTLNTAKGQSLKHVKACPKVMGYFSSESEGWDPSESEWQDWQPTADVAKRPGWKYVSRNSQDICVQRLGGESCRVFIILSWQDPKASAADTEQAAPPPEQATQEAPADA